MLNRFQDNLRTIVVKHTGFRKSIAETFVRFVFGMIELGSVKHKKLALNANGKTVESDIRKVERFFAHNFISSQCIGSIIYELLNLRQYGKLTIIIDRTNWDFGNKHINVFVATIVLENCAIPIALEVFDKKGSTNFQERKNLLKQVISLVGIENIKVLLADREFIGDDWFSLLYKQKLPFTIRIRNNFYVEFKGTKIKVSALMANIKKNEKREFNVKLGSVYVRLAARKSDDGELVIVVAPRYFRGDLLRRYKVRWLIELYFKSIKSLGFNLEETHMTDPDRIKGLMAVIAVASALTTATGRFRHQVKKIPIKAHGRPAFSIFTYGLDFLRAILQGRRVASISTSTTPSIVRPWSNLIN